MNEILLLAAGMLAAVFIVIVAKRPLYGVYIGFFLSAILITPNLPVVGTKLAPPDLPLIVALIGSMFSVKMWGRVYSTGSKYVTVALMFGVGFLLWTVVSVLINAIATSVLLADSIIDILNYFYGFMVLMLVLVTVDSWGKWRRCLVSWVLGTIVVSVVSVLATLGYADWARHAEGWRISSTFKSVNQLHSYVAPMIPILLYFVMRYNNNIIVRLLGVLALIGAIYAMLVTGSRTAAFLIVLAIAAFGVVVYRQVINKPLALLSFMTMGSFLVVGAIYYLSQLMLYGADSLPEGMQAVNRIVERTLLEDNLEDVAGPRGEQWRIVKDNWYSYAIIGVGTSRFQSFFSNEHEVHNTYLGVLIEQGVPGLFMLIGFVVMIITGGYAESSRAKSTNSLIMRVYLLSFLLLCAYGAFSFGLRQRIFWLAGGLALCAIMLAYKQRAFNKLCQ